jgi:hypothetical protein
MYKYTYSECTEHFPEISRDRAENLVACAEPRRIFFSLYFHNLSLSFIRPLARTLSLSLSLSRVQAHSFSCHLFPSPSIQQNGILSFSGPPFSVRLVSVGGLPGAREAFCDVAVSRARRRCVVAASLTGRAISLPRVHSSTRSISLVFPSLRAAGINCIPSPANGRHPHCQSPSVPLRLPARHPACLLVFSTQCRTRRFYVPALEQLREIMSTAYRYPSRIS